MLLKRLHKSLLTPVNSLVQAVPFQRQTAFASGSSCFTVNMMYSVRGFANINYDSIVPQNSVTKVYNDLVDSGQIRADPKQQAVISILEKWQ